MIRVCWGRVGLGRGDVCLNQMYCQIYVQKRVMYSDLEGVAGSKEWERSMCFLPILGGSSRSK